MCAWLALGLGPEGSRAGPWANGGAACCAVTARLRLRLAAALSHAITRAGAAGIGGGAARRLSPGTRQSRGAPRRLRQRCRGPLLPPRAATLTERNTGKSSPRGSSARWCRAGGDRCCQDPGNCYFTTPFLLPCDDVCARVCLHVACGKCRVCARRRVQVYLFLKKLLIC